MQSNVREKWRESADKKEGRRFLLKRQLLLGKKKEEELQGKDIKSIQRTLESKAQLWDSLRVHPPFPPLLSSMLNSDNNTHLSNKLYESDRTEGLFL
jgi:hypothetical protein